MGSVAMAIAEAAAAAQRLRREAEKGIRFRRSAGRVVQARRVAKCMNIGKYGQVNSDRINKRITCLNKIQGEFEVV